MPAAAILINPADAVDCKLFYLNFLKDTGFLGAACFNYMNFCFHVILLLFFVALIQGALWYKIFFAMAMPTNITLMYSTYPTDSDLISMAVLF
jgi:hypothetical protein